nr:hypothetical protein Iba_chr05aCG10910 [Ipomoea batatas]
MLVLEVPVFVKINGFFKVVFMLWLELQDVSLTCCAGSLFALTISRCLCWMKLMKCSPEDSRIRSMIFSSCYHQRYRLVFSLLLCHLRLLKSPRVSSLLTPGERLIGSPTKCVAVITQFLQLTETWTRTLGTSSCGNFGLVLPECLSPLISWLVVLMSNKCHL